MRASAVPTASLHSPDGPPEAQRLVQPVDWEACSKSSPQPGQGFIPCHQSRPCDTGHSPGSRTRVVVSRGRVHRTAEVLGMTLPQGRSEPLPRLLLSCRLNLSRGVCRLLWREKADAERIIPGIAFSVLSSKLSSGGVGRTRPHPILWLKEGRTPGLCLFPQF